MKFYFYCLAILLSSLSISFLAGGTNSNCATEVNKTTLLQRGDDFLEQLRAAYFNRKVIGGNLTSSADSEQQRFVIFIVPQYYRSVDLKEYLLSALAKGEVQLADRSVNFLSEFLKGRIELMGSLVQMRKLLEWTPPPKVANANSMENMAPPMQYIQVITPAGSAADQLLSKLDPTFRARLIDNQNIPHLPNEFYVEIIFSEEKQLGLRLEDFPLKEGEVTVANGNGNTAGAVRTAKGYMEPKDVIGVLLNYPSIIKINEITQSGRHRGRGARDPDETAGRENKKH